MILLESIQLYKEEAIPVWQVEHERKRERKIQMVVSEKTFLWQIEKRKRNHDREAQMVLCEKKIKIC